MKDKNSQAGKCHLAGINVLHSQTNVPMATELIVTSRILINAPIATVWDALTNPEQTKKYMFGCETVSDWTVGSPLLWQGIWEDQAMIFVKGTIVAIKPPTHLAYTTFDPNSTLEDIPDNYVIVTYDLSEENGQTRLVVTLCIVNPKWTDADEKRREGFKGFVVSEKYDFSAVGPS